MARLIFSFLFIIALDFCHAQGNRFSNQDGFFFPGEAERPSKFPLNTLKPTRPPFVTRPTTVSPTSSTPSFNTYNRCFNDCRTTSEYNPVCGTDNVVYSNPGRLNCARDCGNMIDIKNYGQC